MSVSSDILALPSVQSLPDPLQPYSRSLNRLVTKSPQESLVHHLDQARMWKVAFVVKTIFLGTINLMGFIFHPFVGVLILPFILHFCKRGREQTNEEVEYHVAKGTIEKGVLQELKTIEFYTDKQMIELLEKHQIFRGELDLAPLRQIDPDISELHLLKPITARMIYWKKRAILEKMELHKLNRADSKTLTLSHIHMYAKYCNAKANYQHLTKLIKYPTYGSEWN